MTPWGFHVSPASSSQDLVQIADWAAPVQRGRLSLDEAVEQSRDADLKLLYRGSQKVLEEIESRKLPHWVATFSGGKDSTLTTLLVAEYLARMESPPVLDIVYSDTLMEIPAMRRAAGSFLRYTRRFARSEDLPIRVHVVTPKVEERFWVRMIGRGYPPPKPKFRWCTKRLKIAPSAPFVATGEATAVMTGVRYGESAQRTGRLVA